MTRRKPRMHPVAWERPPDAPPLRDVVAQIDAKTRRLGELDDEIERQLTAIERAIRARRPSGHPASVPFPPWGRLGWSGRRGRWRLVVLEDDACTDLSRMPRVCRVDAYRVLGALVQRLGLVPGAT